MGKMLHHYELPVIFIFLLFINHSEQLQTSQVQTLLRIQQLLNFPVVLSSWNNNTDFCNTESNSSSTVICYEGSITQLHIIGNKGTPLLPRNFSLDSFVTTLVKLPDLKVLALVSLGLWGTLPGKIARLSSLEIFNVTSNFLYGSIPQELSSLTSLQTLILDDNMFAGQLPDWLGSLPVLAVLSLKKNSFNGSLPSALSNLENLRVLALSHNHFFGAVPDFERLTNLQVLDLEDNAFGPQFPRLGNKLVTLVLSKNRFRSGIPAEVSSYYQLQWLDLSINTFVGRFPTSLLSLPSITYLSIAGNKFTGMLFENLSCSSELEFVDFSSNLLTGSLPSCLLTDSKERVVLYARNCLATGKQSQHPFSFCRNEALAVGIPPHHKNQKEASKTLFLAIIGGLVGGIALLGLAYLMVRRVNARRETKVKKPPTRLIAENASTGYTSKILSDARYISQTMKMGELGLPAYRTFSLEELEEATNNFDTSAFMGEGSHGQMYRGRLKDGSIVAVRCLKMKKSHSTQNFMHYIELILKLRHRHLVSALGHCFECYLDDSSVSRIFFVFEYVPNGTLRSWISEGHSQHSLTWTQRITAAIGVAKGIQFLHTGIVPGVYSNNIKITDILLDQNLVAKISCYNLPLLAENMVKCTFPRGKSFEFIFSLSSSLQFGHGSLPSGSKDPILQGCIAADDVARRNMVDPAVHKACLDQSLKTMMEICVRCLLKDPADRPSLEDVLWNLQFAAQVQDAWHGDFQSNEGSPVSASHSRRLTFH
ncbi:putative inactive leucine-rich repeat receptor-like protein kinase [Quercus suber]|uniref:Inactive leucine-rich repeat receptor-like protein kinase n=1 Tax=Quercus suber TaxID=58331 RepID=A0AAW0KUB0_QUESU